jgi:hypothetical protein
MKKAPPKKKPASSPKALKALDDDQLAKVIKKAQKSKVGFVALNAPFRVRA